MQPTGSASEQYIGKRQQPGLEVDPLLVLLNHCLWLPGRWRPRTQDQPRQVLVDEVPPIFLLDHTLERRKVFMRLPCFFREILASRYPVTTAVLSRSCTSICRGSKANVSPALNPAFMRS